MENEEKKMSASEKTIAIITIITIICSLFLIFKMAINNRTDQDLKVAVEKQKQKDQIETNKYKKLYDSISQENKTERRIILIIDKAIKKNLNENTYNKQRAVTSNDTVKHSISDSLLRANGFR